MSAGLQARCDCRVAAVRFVRGLLSPDQAAPLWQAAQAQAAVSLGAVA